MKNKLMMFSVAACLWMGAGAQTYSTMTTGSTSVGLTAGVNWFNINGKNATGADLNNSLKTGFNGGLNVEFPLGAGTYLQPGIEYRQKGTEMANGNTVNLNYIDVPVNLVLKPALGTSNVVIGFGPYVGYGLNGKVEYPNGTKKNVQFNDTYITSEAADAQFKRLDAGANVMAGLEFSNRLSVMAKAQLGLKNINPDTEISADQTRYRNTGFGVSLGYRF